MASGVASTMDDVIIYTDDVREIQRSKCEVLRLRVRNEHLSMNEAKKNKEILDIQREMFWLLRAIGHEVKKVTIPSYVDGKVKYVNVWVKKNETSWTYDVSANNE